MFDHIRPDFHDFETAAASVPMRGFLHENARALTDAAALLAGRRGMRLAQTVIDDFAAAAGPFGSTCRALEELRAILTLEHVHDETREEAGFFALIDPADPIVEDVCLLADGYTEALDRSDLARATRAYGRKLA